MTSYTTFTIDIIANVISYIIYDLTHDVTYYVKPDVSYDITCAMIHDVIFDVIFGMIWDVIPPQSLFVLQKRVKSPPKYAERAIFTGKYA